MLVKRTIRHVDADKFEREFAATQGNKSLTFEEFEIVEPEDVETDDEKEENEQGDEERSNNSNDC